MKPSNIKFDLKLSDGTKLCRLDDLEENLSPALFEHFHSGKLAKWLRVRKLEELADKVEALRAEHLDDKNELDVKLFKDLCEIFVSELDLDDARQAVEAFKALPVVEIENTDEIEESKAVMVIEQPKIKEFHVNERLLYKTFIELGKDAYVKGETKPSEELLALCRKLSISIGDVLISFGGLMLTNNYLMFLSQFHQDMMRRYENSKGSTKILLNDILHLNCEIINDSQMIVVVNNHFFIMRNEIMPFYLFLKDYLALEPIEDKFERIEIME